MSGRPELGDVEVGDLVFVERSPNDMRGRPATERYIEARVAVANRVWLVIEETGTGSLIGHAWKMRRDSQDEGTQYSGSNASFVTSGQRKFDERLKAADEYLRAEGVRVDWHGRWGEPERRVLLAQTMMTALIDRGQS